MRIAPSAAAISVTEGPAGTGAAEMVGVGRTGALRTTTGAARSGAPQAVTVPTTRAATTERAALGTDDGPDGAITARLSCGP